MTRVHHVYDMYMQHVYDICMRITSMTRMYIHHIYDTYVYALHCVCEICIHLLLSRFSHVRFCAARQTAAHQAPPSLGFSRQEHWSGLPFPSPMHESEK